ncbi:MAG: malic enzyme-like NAD(P)-binding protein [archaeon]
MDTYEKSLMLHEKYKGKISTISKLPILDKETLSLAYTPGVARASEMIHENPDDVYKYTFKSNTVAIVSDGSAVLGLGNIGAKAAIPVMEGKALLFKEFAGIDAFPICIDSNDVEEIVRTCRLIAPVFGGINLEDISAPRCFEIEERLKSELDIPVFHDDQHGTAIVVLAALTNSLKVVKKKKEDIKIVVNGAGAAGTAITKFLFSENYSDIILCDSKGIISKKRTDLNPIKNKLLEITNKASITGSLKDALKHADVFIGVSVGNIVTSDMIKTMNIKPIIFALANPTPEIMPNDAKQGGAFIIATGRSDFSNQINNVLGFPGIFRGALNVRASDINNEMKKEASYALAKIVESPSQDCIIPSVFDKNVVKHVSEAVESAARKTKVSRI